jgi:hypothetical protein
MARPFILQVARSLVPYRQGELDGLCGLYATINALRLASSPAHPMPLRHAHALADIGFAYLNKRKKLQRAVSEGMGSRLRMKLARHLITHANTLSLQTYQMRELDIAPDTYAQTIEAEIMAQRPVCTTLNGALDHFTVICGFSQTQYHLFDSDGLSRVFRTSCSLKGKAQATGRYRIDTGSMFSVEVRSKPAN